LIIAAALSAAAMPGVAAPNQGATEHAGHEDKAAPATPRILEGYGNGGFTIRTRSPKAQTFFDIGMALAAAFALGAAI
jgi:hypothetical protein